MRHITMAVLALTLAACQSDAARLDDLRSQEARLYTDMLMLTNALDSLEAHGAPRDSIRAAMVRIAEKESEQAIVERDIARLLR